MTTKKSDSDKKESKTKTQRTPLEAVKFPCPIRKKGRTKWKGPPTEKERNQVYAFALHGVTNPHIAAIMEMSEDTLKKYFQSDLTAGRANAVDLITQTLLKVAIGDENNPPDKTVLIFLAKTRCNMKETIVNENITVNDKVTVFLPENNR